MTATHHTRRIRPRLPGVIGWRATSRESLVLLALRGLFKAFQFGFLFLVARSLSQASYGDFTFVATVVNLVAQPTIVLTLVVARIGCSFDPTSAAANMRWMLLRSRGRAALLGAATVACFVLLDPYLSALGNVAHPGFFAIAGVTIAGSLLLNYYLGFLQAQEAFRAIGLIFALTGLLLFAFGAVAVGLDLGLTGVLSAEALSRVAVLAAALWCLLRALPAPAAAPPDKTFPATRYALHMFVIMLAFFAAFSMDVFVVKSLFGRDEAGYYMRLDFIGKMIFLLGSTLAVILFPRTSKAFEQRRDTLPVLQRISAVYLAFLAMAVVLLLFFREAAFHVLYGPDFSAEAWLLWTIVATRAVQSYLFILLNHIMAGTRQLTLPCMLGVVAVQGVALWAWHGSLAGIAAVSGLSALAFACILLAVASRPAHRAAAA